MAGRPENISRSKSEAIVVRLIFFDESGSCHRGAVEKSIASGTKRAPERPLHRGATRARRASSRAWWIVFSVLSLCQVVRAETQDPLAAQVTIYRDGYGVPHIVGETQEATFFGYGYAQAQDHLEEMMVQYRDAQGRRSEVLGHEALGDKYLHFSASDYRWGGDYLQRLLRTWQCVVDKREKIDPAVYKILDAFARS